jgi:hypothetical protein
MVYYEFNYTHNTASVQDGYLTLTFILENKTKVSPVFVEKAKLLIGKRIVIKMFSSIKLILDEILIDFPFYSDNTTMTMKLFREDANPKWNQAINPYYSTGGY